ncbi:hypothetical protein QM306_38915, partial [Burkholderia cenocepacia]|nr:hypothetical protein [Burkholderia cenocepacia]
SSPHPWRSAIANSTSTASTGSPSIAHGCGLDIHLHERGSMGAYSLDLILQRTAAHGMQGKVTISHGFCLGDIAERELAQPGFGIDVDVRADARRAGREERTRQRERRGARVMAARRA